MLKKVEQNFNKYFGYSKDNLDRLHLKIELMEYYTELPDKQENL